MTIDLDAIQNRLDRGVESLTDTYDLVREVKRLLKLLINAGWPREAEELAALALRYERAATVAYLRGLADDYGVCLDLSLAEQADKIERGEHRREEKP